MRGVITLLTDFGTADGYVAEIKGVLLTSAPGAVLVDVTHDIAPHDVEIARLTLARYWRRFPPGSVHLAIVDPGVGSSRAAIAVESEGQRLVGPDNGLLSPALLVAGARVVRLPLAATAAPTFHGRDVFAPAAARLASGEPLDALGETFTGALVRRTPEPRRTADGQLEGVVIAVDRFGNAITNLVGARGTTLSVHGRELHLRRTYADLREGEPGAVVGSSGLIEIALREGSASDALGIRRGTPVTLR